MEGNPKQEALSLIREADEILILLPLKPDEDAVGSGLALKLFLEKLGKRVNLVASEPIPAKVSFLKGAENILSEIPGGRDFIISLKTDKASAEKLSYHLDEGRLNIVVTVKEGEFTPEDLSLRRAKPKVDLLVTVDTPNLARLGPWPSLYPEIFQDGPPLLNIDHHLSNDFFGRVNLVDSLASATAEILLGLFEAINRELIDKEIATCLLTGLLADTGGFQNNNTTPKSLTVGAQLLGFGAHHSEVVKSIFKIRRFSTLKLWGRALHRLTFQQATGLVWSKLVQQDFEETGAQASETAGLIDELIKGTEGARAALLLKEYGKNKIHGSLRAAEKGFDVLELAQLFGGGGHLEAAGFELEGAMEEVEQRVLEVLSRHLSPASTVSPFELEERAATSLE